MGDKPYHHYLTDFCQVVTPRVSTRPATNAEHETLSRWLDIYSPALDDIRIIEFSDGALTHAPEVIACVRSIIARLPQSLAIVYVHRGHWAQCLTPLLQSLLHAVNHQGPAFALRCEDSKTPNCCILDFAYAQLQHCEACLIVDDRQKRVGTASEVVCAEAHLHAIRKPATPGSDGATR